MSPKIFCIGMNKTGTTSLHEALTIMGLSSCHHRHGAERGRDLIEAARTAGIPLLSKMPDYDAYSDMSLHFYLAELDAQYPGSKFIHTTRDVEGWVSSGWKHNERHNARNSTDPRPTDAAAIAEWVRVRDEVEAQIARYFAGRPGDVLKMNIPAGDGWELLCPFLDRPIPPTPFPHQNPAQNRTANHRGLRRLATEVWRRIRR